MLTNDDTAEFMDKAFTAGAALFTTSIQYMAMRALFRNADEYAAKIQMPDGSDAKFKNSKKFRHLRKLLIDMQPTGSRKRTQRPDDRTAAVLAQLSEESSVSEEAPAPKKRKRSKKAKKDDSAQDGTLKKA